MGFQVVVVRFRSRGGGPEKRVVVGEHGEDDPKEEGRRCAGSRGLVFYCILQISLKMGVECTYGR